MPSALRTPSPVTVKPVKVNESAPDVYRLDPDGDVVLVLTRFVSYVDDEEIQDLAPHLTTLKHDDDYPVEEGKTFDNRNLNICQLLMLSKRLSSMCPPGI